MNKTSMISLFLCICLMASVFSGLTISANADEGVINYKVESGDYLFKICRDNGLDYYQCKAAIMALNGFTTETQLNRISVGQQIKLPADNAIAATVKASSTTTTTVATTTVVGGKTTVTTTSSTVAGSVGGASGVAFYLVPHVVASGETLNSICNSLGTSYDANSTMILSTNGLASANKLQAGKQVYVPSTTVSNGGYAVVEHTVRSGENLTSICTQYGWDYNKNPQIVNGLNNGKNLNKIYVGQKLYIPVAATTASTSGVISTSSVPAASSAISTSGYAIKFEDTENGSPYATLNSARVTSADAGKRVQIVSNADYGYNIKSVKAIRLDTSANLIITENSFVMPASAVAVTVTYSEAMRLTKTSAANGKFNLLVNGSDEAYANYGDAVTVLPIPNDGYAVKKITYKMTKNGSNETTVYPDSTGAYKFNMPNYPATVSVQFEKANYYKINKNITGKGSGTVNFVVNSSEATKAASGTVVSININPADNSSVNKVTVNGKDYGYYNFTKVNDNCYTFTMPEAEVIVAVDFYKEVTYALTYTEKDGGYVRFAVKDPIKNTLKYGRTSARAGDLVIVMPQPASGYKYNEANTIATYAKGDSKVTLSSYDPTYVGYTFTMPAADVNVNAFWTKDETVKRRNITATTSEHGSYYYQVDDGSGKKISAFAAVVGSIVDVYLNPDDGYLVAWDKNNHDYVYYHFNDADYLAKKVSDNHYQFKMPDADTSIIVKYYRQDRYATVEKTVEKIYDTVPGSISVKANGVEIDSSASNVKAGTVLTITCNPYKGYKLKSLTVNDSTADLKKQSDNVYTYTCKVEDCESGKKIAIYTIFAADNYTVLYSTPDAAIGSYEIWVDGVNRGKAGVNDAHVGQKIELKNIAVADTTKYEVDQVIVDDIDVTDDVESGIYSFTMPEKNVLTKVTFKEKQQPKVKYTVSVGTLTNVDPSSVHFNLGEAEVGETVTVSASAISGFTIPTNGYVICDEYGTYLTEGASFTMPACNVKVNITAEAN